MSGPLRLTIDIPDDLIEQIVVEVVRRLCAEERPAGRWLYGAAAAAEYLGWPTARVYRSLPQLPHNRDGRRLVFSTQQLDSFLADAYAGPERFAARRSER